jgi:hypothetical protein
MNKPRIDIITNMTIGIGAFTTTPRPPIEIVKSMLASLNKGRIAEFVGEFDSLFTFSDHALDLQFNERQRLTEFLQKSRQLFSDTVIEIVSAYQCGETAIAEWKLTATENVSHGSMMLRLPISLWGVSIVQFQKQKVTHWSDCYDQLKSRRVGLAAAFAECIEY